MSVGLEKSQWSTPRAIMALAAGRKACYAQATKPAWLCSPDWDLTTTPTSGRWLSELHAIGNSLAMKWTLRGISFLFFLTSTVVAIPAVDTNGNFDFFGTNRGCTIMCAAGLLALVASCSIKTEK